MIHLLWPTVRPDMMSKTYKHWMQNADDPLKTTIKIACNTETQAKALIKHGFIDILAVGEKYRGVAPATYVLAENLAAEKAAKPKDIVILASDDFYAPKGWDTWLENQFAGYNGSLLVNDGYQTGNIVTIPIMTYACLQKLNNIIYHPEYIHMWSDAELYRNLADLKLIKNVRKTSPMFEHRHPDAGKRKKDAVDEALNKTYTHADKMYKKRMAWPLHKRLEMPQKWIEFCKNAIRY